MKSQTRTVRDLAVGDRFRARAAMGWRDAPTVAEVSPDEFRATAWGSKPEMRFCRDTGLELGDIEPAWQAMITSVAVIPDALKAAVDERDRLIQDWFRSNPMATLPTELRGNESRQAAYAIWEADPLHPDLPELGRQFLAQATDRAQSPEARSDAATLLGRYEYPIVIATLIEIAGSTDSPELVVEAAARALGLFWLTEDIVAADVLDQLLPLARAELRRLIPWIEVGRARAWECAGCAVDTQTIDEYYMLQNALWESVSTEGERLLCIGCVEDRLGRTLTAADFTEVDVNRSPGWSRSARLMDRLGLAPIEEVRVE
ncbi:HEAT repeat domain-containing protein [Nocardia camponoti]|uniref:HEAT repeat domain-containing protein n=1 Tax=Nocardia camponoti TaxID=1616106 RepID=A0A917Q7V3_9NOCA|nr:HEAT repeat domain-containing protein [Nocardia camponoti]GGK32816.1 hypothetical protein GCM10011591_00630 [Nocardia camponoti]